MNRHSHKRLLERFGFSVEYFQKEFKNSVDNKMFFKKDFQDPIYENCMNICVKIGNVILVAALRKDNGEIRTIMRASGADFDKADKLGWDIKYPKWYK